VYGGPISLAVVPSLDKVYVLNIGDANKLALDGAHGWILHTLHHDPEDSLYYSPSSNRVFVSMGGIRVTAIDPCGDTAVGIVPLTPGITDMCIDTFDNKLYFTDGLAGVGIVDCSTNKVESYRWTDREPANLAFDARDDKMYCSEYWSLAVFDCKADTAIKVIPLGGRVNYLCWHPGQDAIYAITGDVYDGHLVKIDCKSDSVIDTGIVLATPGGTTTFLCPELNQLWHIAGGYTVVDCVGDSILADSHETLNLGPASFDSSNHRVYAVGWKMYVIDMKTQRVVDSISAGERISNVYCVPQVHKAYAFESIWKGPDTAVVVDTRTDSITSRFAIPTYMGARVVLGDRSGNYIYVAGLRDTTFMGGTLSAIDTRTDSIVHKIYLVDCPTQIVRSSTNNCLYCNVAGTDSTIQVVYDTIILAGLSAEHRGVPQAKYLQTVLNRNTPLRSQTDAALFDASGRRAAVLNAGPNDISHLAPGVYFVREEPQAASQKPQAIRKVVLTR
jgi:DNA-binding beta-propeller fold protein YncE